MTRKCTAVTATVTAYYDLLWVIKRPTDLGIQLGVDFSTSQVANSFIGTVFTPAPAVLPPLSAITAFLLPLRMRTIQSTQSGNWLPKQNHVRAVKCQNHILDGTVCHVYIETRSIYQLALLEIVPVLRHCMPAIGLHCSLFSSVAFNHRPHRPA